MTKEHEEQIRDEIALEVWLGEWDDEPFADEDDEDIVGECENCGEAIREGDEDVIGVLDRYDRRHMICGACSREMSAGDLFDLCGCYWHTGDWREVSNAIGGHVAAVRKIREAAV